MKNHKQVTKAVIALAGYGTRFLPATKNQPKQMLPIIDKPIVHYVVEEAVKSGIRDVILVTQAGQHSMEDYFDSQYEIEKVLEDNGKAEYLKIVREIPEMANFIFVRQHKNLPYGNGTPLLTVANLIDDDEAFVYMFGDDLTRSAEPVTKQLIDVYNKYGPKAVLGVQEVPDSEVDRYGTVKYKKNPEIPNEMELILEKMPLGQNPSNMAQFGRFVFSYDVIEEANRTPTGKGNELWITDILCNMAKRGDKVLAEPIDGEWLTTGDPLHFLQTTLKFALDREDLRDDIKAYMKDLLK